MPKNKQPLTPTKAEKVTFSLQKLIVMAQVIQYEHMTELDADFRIPNLNNFAKRIGSDAQAIIDHLRRSGKMVPKDYGSVEEYSAVIWRVLDLLIGLPIEEIKEFTKNLEAVVV